MTQQPEDDSKRVQQSPQQERPVPMQESPTQQPESFDRPADMDELDFEDDEPSEPIGEPVTQDQIDLHQPPERARKAGLTEGEIPGEGPTPDDMAPEVLIPEDGARSPDEPGSGPPVDKALRTADESEIGGGTGLDEAELAQAENQQQRNNT